MTKEIVAKILVEYQRYQSLVKAAAAPPAPSIVESSTTEKEASENADMESATPEKEAAENAPAVEKNAGAPPSETAAAVKARPSSPAKEEDAELSLSQKLEQFVKKVPPSVKERAGVCTQALLRLKKIRLKDGGIYRGRRQIVSFSQLEAVYKEPFNAHAEFELISLIKSRAKLFAYQPTLSTTWFRL